MEKETGKGKEKKRKRRNQHSVKQMILLSKESIRKRQVSSWLDASVGVGVRVRVGVGKRGKKFT